MNRFALLLFLALTLCAGGGSDDLAEEGAAESSADAPAPVVPQAVPVETDLPAAHDEATLDPAPEADGFAQPEAPAQPMNPSEGARSEATATPDGARIVPGANQDVMGAGMGAGERRGAGTLQGMGSRPGSIGAAAPPAAAAPSPARRRSTRRARPAPRSPSAFDIEE